MPKVLLWVVWLALCFAHIVRLVMPYSKRLPLSRGYLIVRGRRCFQEFSFFFSWPIKVAQISGIRPWNLPLLLGWSYCRALLIVEIISPSLLYPRRWSVLFVLFDWAECTGHKYEQMLCISGWKWPWAAILTRSLRAQLYLRCVGGVRREYLQYFFKKNAYSVFFPWTTKSLSNYQDGACHETLDLIMLPSAVVRAEHLETT